MGNLKRRRRGFLGRIMDRLFGPIKKPQAETVPDKKQQEVLKEHMENLRRNTEDVAACGVTMEQIRRATERMVRGDTVNDVSNDDKIQNREL